MDMAVDQTGAGDRRSTRLSSGGGKRPRWQAVGSWGLTSLSDLSDPHQRAWLARRRCGCIVTAGGQLLAIHGRWWPYRGNLLRSAWDARYGGLPEDECELYYHQPLATPSFLTLSYVHAGEGTSLTTLYTAGLVLDEIARLKRADAIVSHVTNGRISDRLLARWGWEPHCLNWHGRHFIKRFYGRYPELASHWRRRLTLEP